MTQNRIPPVGRLSLAHRVTFVVLGVVGLTFLLVARNLEPDQRGFGTHEQLGLTPCLFQRWTGHACPTCGATTAWAYTVRGQLAQAAAVHLGGTLLCVATMIAVPWLFVSASVGRWIVCRLRVRDFVLAGTAWLLVVLLDWLQRLFLS